MFAKPLQSICEALGTLLSKIKNLLTPETDEVSTLIVSYASLLYFQFIKPALISIFAFTKSLFTKLYLGLNDIPKASKLCLIFGNGIL